MTTCRRLLLFCVHRTTPFSARTPQKTPSTPLPLRLFSSKNNDKNDPTETHADYLKQVQELNDERQALFGFTKEEEEAWQNPQVHSSTLLDAVENTRQRAQQPSEPHHDVDFRQEEAVECTTPFPSHSSLVQGMHPHDEDENTVFTHLDTDNKEVNMVDVGNKQVTKRTAKARTTVKFPPEVMAAFSSIENELVGPKGPIFSTAKIAGIMAAKRTSDLIPLCHPLPLDKVKIDIQLQDNTALIECECRTTSKTGVEMEALTGASIAALTIYDMVKAVSHRVTIQETLLISKFGGKRNVDVDKEEDKDE